MNEKSAISWFEIPVSDMARAGRFYNAIFRTELCVEEFGGMPMAMFPKQGEHAVTGCLVKSPQMNPSAQGTVVYLNAEGDLDGVLKRTSEAGGKVVMGRTSIGEYGFIGLIMDTEGNHVGLYSTK